MAKSKYDPKTFPFKVEHYKKQKLSDKQIAQNLGISERTFYTYLKKYPQFLQAYTRGKIEVVEELENAVFKRALGFEYEITTTDTRKDEDGNIKYIITRKIKKQLPPDTQALIWLLSNLNNQKWKRNPDLAGGSIDVQLQQKTFSQLIKEKNKRTTEER